jgi:hypothetical protein
LERDLEKGLERDLEKGKEEEEKHHHSLMDLLNTFHFTHGELKSISLISWNFLQKPNSWFWMLYLESLAGGGSINCGVS